MDGRKGCRFVCLKGREGCRPLYEFLYERSRTMSNVFHIFEETVAKKIRGFFCMQTGKGGRIRLGISVWKGAKVVGFV